MDKVAIYVRLSKEDMKKIIKGDDSESIKNQKLMLSEYAASKGWQIYDFYVDEDYSGADRNRPSFDRLLKDAENREFEIVLCKTQNRFARDLEAVEKIIHGKFLEWGIRFVTLIDGADTADESNKKSRQIHGMVDEWYLEDLSKNIRTVFRSKMEDGQYLGAFPPYGYMKDPNNKHKLIIDEEAAQVVRKIYNLYLKGYGTHKIAKILTEEGIVKPAIYMRQSHAKNFNIPNMSEYGLWGHTTIRRILRNPVYIGTLVQGKETTISYKNKKRIYLDEDDWVKVENTHEPIISEKDFYEVQRLIDSKRRNVKKKGKAHIFATKVRCLHCGGAMIRSTTRSRKSEDLTYVYLKCKNNAKGGDLICKYRNRISYTELYNYIESEFIRLIGIYKNNPKASEATSRQIKRIDYAEERRKLVSALKVIEGDIKEREKILTNLYIDKAKGIVSEKDYRTISFTLQEEREQLELREKDIKKKLDELKRLESEKVNIEKVIESYLKYHKLTHEIVNETIDYIEIGSKEDGQNRIINVYWKL
ncbi:recombinase family protein [Xylanivirga thermophila]|uniref:recombinase family protein n=1 Tax=Xylanivirga thermophila TaxID=2496273 RepID=UPI0013EC21C4|nr:recombinase family protein [Xylanivirga thermophila]